MNEWNLNTVIAVGALIAAVFAIVVKALDKSLTIREHDEYKRSTQSRLKEIQERQDQRLLIREFDDWRLEFRHDIDRLEDAIKVLDQAKPTTGELNIVARSFESRLAALENIIQHLNGNK